MCKNKFIFILLILLNSSTKILAQNKVNDKLAFGDGLSINGGVSFLAVKDEYISLEKYSATVPYFAISWSRLHETYGYRLQLEYESTSSLKNYNVSARVVQFSLNLDFLYPLGTARIFSKNVSFFLGPSSELFGYVRSQNISPYSISNANSFLELVSGGIRAEAYYPLLSGVQITTFLQTSILSVGVKQISAPDGGNETATNILTPFSGLHSDLSINIAYNLTNSFSATSGYRFDVVNVNAWDLFTSAEDMFIASVSYNF